VTLRGPGLNPDPLSSDEVDEPPVGNVRELRQSLYASRVPLG